MELPVAGTSNVRQVVPFFGVRDIEASLRFYVGGLGFTVTDRWSPGGRLRWCWLQLGDAALMLQEHDPAGHGAGAPDGVPGLGVSIYFICADALEVYRELRARSVATETPFVGNGMWVVTLRDPDGYQLHFESPTDVAEGTLLAAPVA